VKILLTANKTYRGKLDNNYSNVYLPLKRLGHEVYFYDTTSPNDKSFRNVIEDEKPDLIFCCMTGDQSITPFEPWEDVLEETNKGNIKTFNWFCDDTWRFESFSSKACRYFNICSTPEPSYLQRYKDVGYDNIILGNWHVNYDLYKPYLTSMKDLDLLFVGYPTDSRKYFFDLAKRNEIKINNLYGLSQEQMIEHWCRSRIGLNLSTNDNDPTDATQMKLRMFEVPAAGSLLFTQHHSGIEEFYEIDSEIITFKTFEEFSKKAKFLLKNRRIVQKISNNGHKRFIKEHQSTARLTSVLDKIKAL